MCVFFFLCVCVCSLYFVCLSVYFISQFNVSAIFFPTSSSFRRSYLCHILLCVVLLLSMFVFSTKPSISICSPVSEPRFLSFNNLTYAVWGATFTLYALDEAVFRFYMFFSPKNRGRQSECLDLPPLLPPAYPCIPPFPLVSSLHPPTSASVSLPHSASPSILVSLFYLPFHRLEAPLTYQNLRSVSRLVGDSS